MIIKIDTLLQCAIKLDKMRLLVVARAILGFFIHKNLYLKQIV